MAETVRVRVVGREHGRHKTGDEFEIRKAVAERHPNSLEVIETGSDEDETTEDSDSDETEDGYTCMGNDGDCSRSVDGPESYCWQHSD